MLYWNGDLSDIMAEAPRGRGDWKASHPHGDFGRRFEGDAIA